MYNLDVSTFFVCICPIMLCLSDIYVIDKMEGTFQEDIRTKKSKRRTQLQWTDAMDKTLIELLAEKAAKGNKIDKTFKPRAYVFVSRELSILFLKDV